MTSPLTFFNNSSLMAPVEPERIVLNDNTVIIVDGLELTKQDIINAIIDSKILKNELQQIRGSL